MATKLKTFEVDGITLEISVSDDGTFQSLFRGDWIEAPSLKGLQEKLRRVVRTRSRVAIPVTLIRDDYDADGKLTIRQVSLTGIHGRNRNAMYRDDRDQTTEQEGYSDNFYQRIPNEQIPEIVALWKARCAAMKAWEEWKGRHHVDARTLIEEAQNQVMQNTPEATS